MFVYRLQVAVGVLGVLLGTVFGLSEHPLHAEVATLDAALRRYVGTSR